MVDFSDPPHLMIPVRNCWFKDSQVWVRQNTYRIVTCSQCLFLLINLMTNKTKFCPNLSLCLVSLLSNLLVAHHAASLSLTRRFLSQQKRPQWHTIMCIHVAANMLSCNACRTYYYMHM